MSESKLDEAVETAVGDMPAPLTYSQAWPKGYVDGYNDAMKTVEEQMRAALLAGVKVLLGEPVAWTTAKPTEPGAYWVKGYAYGRSSEKALVEVRMVGGELCSNLHAVNSDNDTDDFAALANHNDSFQWAGPLVYAPSLGEGDGR